MYSHVFTSHIIHHRMLDDLMCSTSGVPTRFACPMLLDGSELDAFNRIFTTMTAIPTEAADFIAFLVKSYATNDVYDTHGGIGADGELVSRGPSWKIKKEYRRQLKKISNRFKCSIDDCIMVDQSFRVKRARGGPINNIDAAGKMRSVVWYQTTTHKEHVHLGSWFDITLTDQAPDRSFLELPREKTRRNDYNQHVKTELMDSNRLVRRCKKCGIADSKTYPHLRCARCSVSSYCSRKCQREDWKTHKESCGRASTVTKVV